MRGGDFSAQGRPITVLSFWAVVMASFTSVRPLVIKGEGWWYIPSVSPHESNWSVGWLVNRNLPTDGYLPVMHVQQG